jgi:hypothetical protein
VISSADVAAGRCTPEDYVEQQETFAALGVALDCLPERDQVVLASRYFNATPLTYQQVGGRLGVSKTRAQQLENRALKVLHDALASSPTRWELLGEVTEYNRQQLRSSLGLPEWALPPCDPLYSRGLVSWRILRMRHRGLRV